jgi:glutathione S-transferase
VTRGLQAAAHDLSDKKWCDGNIYTLADIALGCALGYLAFRFSEIEWRNTYPNLADLSERLEKRTPFIETAPRG